MIPCRILVPALYADYQGAGTNRVARFHSEGDIVLFPPEYATWLKNANMVEIITGVAEQELEVDMIEINEDESEIIEIEPAADIPLASDSAIEFAADHEVDLKLLVGKGTGGKGRIILTDVRKYVAEQVGA